MTAVIFFATVYVAASYCSVNVTNNTTTRGTKSNIGFDFLLYTAALLLLVS